MPPTIEELTTLHEEMQTSFEAFKQANDEALAQKATKGDVDVLTDEKLGRINDVVGEVSAKADKIIEDQKKLDENAERLQLLSDQVKAHDAMLNRPAVSDLTEKESEQIRKEKADFYHGLNADLKARGEYLIPDQEQTVERFASYSKAFNTYLRKGDNPTALTVDEAKELSVGAEADGGYWVTPVMSNSVITRLFETSPMRAICATQTISTDAIVFPNDTNDAATGGWVGEKDTRAETGTPQIGQQRIPVHEQYAEPHATQQLLDDAMINAETWLAGKIADKLSRDENNAFLVGDGAAKPRGILDYGTAATTTADTSRAWGTLQYTASGDASGFAGTDPGDPLIDLVHSMKAAYRSGARWLMARLTVAEVRKLKDGQNNYLWDMGNIRDNQPQSLLGYPISEGEDMPAVAANAFPIIFGNFNLGYMIVDRQGIRVLRDPFTAKPFVKFYTTKRVGGDVTNFDAVKLFKIEA